MKMRMKENTEHTGMAGKQAVIYVRVSSRDQEREGFSIPAQLSLLREYAHENGFTVVGVFEDVETAKHTGRTHFGKMLEFLKGKPECKTVLVEKTDRLYRNIRDWVTIDELDLEIHLVKESAVISSDSRSSVKFMHGIRVLMAKNFIDNLSEEVTKGMLQKARQGYWPSFAPIGYLNTRIHGRKAIEPDPERAPLVVKLFENYASGDVALGELAKLAGSSGLTHKGSGKPLARSAIHSLLKNRIYYGDFEWDGVVYTGKQEPLVSRELWEKVQSMLSERNGNRVRRAKHDFAFSRLLTCGHCGCSMVGEMKKGKYVYYHCTGFKGKCGEPYTREAVLDEQFCEILGRLEFDEEILEHLRRNASFMDSRTLEECERSTRANRTEYDTLKRKLHTMYDDKLEGIISTDMFRELSESYQQRMRVLEQNLSTCKDEKNNTYKHGVDILEMVRNSRQMYLSGEQREKRRLLRNLLSNCTWIHGTLVAEFKQPYDIVACTNEAYKHETHVCDGSEDIFKMWYPGQDSNRDPSD